VQTARAAKFHEISPRLSRLVRIRHKGEMDQTSGGRQRMEGTGMDLAQNGRAFGMRG
jgi:hypothetical protein